MLFRTSDIVSLHPNLDKTTFHLMNTERLNMMKKDAILINCARGPVVDEVALVNHCRQNREFYAGLDVSINVFLVPIVQCSHESTPLRCTHRQPHLACPRQTIVSVPIPLSLTETVDLPSCRTKRAIMNVTRIFPAYSFFSAPHFFLSRSLRTSR